MLCLHFPVDAYPVLLFLVLSNILISVKCFKSVKVILEQKDTSANSLFNNLYIDVFEFVRF
jgi:hypothetical protein